MNYIKLRTALGPFTVFSLSDIRIIDAFFDRRRLSEWQEKGYIKKITKGKYIFAGRDIRENMLFEIANKLYPPSYVSLESALSYHGLIPGSVYGITSVTSRVTYRFRTFLGGFFYRTINKKLFWGYDIVKYEKKSFKMASPEKSILDYIYLNRHLNSQKDFESLRIDKEAFHQKINKRKFNQYRKRFNKKKFNKRTEAFLKVMQNA